MGFRSHDKFLEMTHRLCITPCSEPKIPGLDSSVTEEMSMVIALDDTKQS